MKKTYAIVALGLFTIAVPHVLNAQTGRADHWVGTWATAVVVRPQAPASPAIAPEGSACAPAAFGPAPGRGGAAAGGRAGFTPPAPLNFKNQTLRQIVHVSLGGDRLRVVLSNAFGTVPLEVGAAHVALREKDATIQTKSDRPLTTLPRRQDISPRAKRAGSLSAVSQWDAYLGRDTAK